MSQSVSQNPEAAVEEELELAEDVAEAVEILDEEAATDEAPEVVPAVVLPIAVDRPVQTVGRRKEAVVRIRLVPGNGTFTLNGRSLDNYFPNKVHQQIVSEPFSTAAVPGSYDVIARIHGGGITGQAGALRLGIARALNSVDAEASRPALKKAGMLTRDSRIKERKKAGLKKARKAPQYSKR